MKQELCLTVRLHILRLCGKKSYNVLLYKHF